MAQVELEDLGKCYRLPGRRDLWALRHVSLTVADGEFLVLLGPSGAGKSTLLRLLAGLETVTEGRLRIGGRVVNDLDPQARDLAMVFQNHALCPHLTAYQNLALGLVLRKTPRTELARRVGETAERLGLGPCLDRKPAALSGGERQRVALGRALVRQPRVLLLDEPLSQLDAPRRAQIRDELADLHRRLGVTLLCATHDQADALALGTRLAVLRDGILQQVGEPLALYQRPANLFVATFVGTPRMNVLRGTLRSRANALWFEPDAGANHGPAPGAFPLADESTGRWSGWVGRPILCGVRPENVHCRPATTPESQAGSASIERIERAGADSYLHLRCQGCAAHRIVARVASDSSWQVGASAALRLDPSQTHFFDPATGRRAD
jgi:multiple sugar transport system ATP-binding protein